MSYESLLREAEQLRIRTYEKTMPRTTKGLYADNVIWINKHISNTAEKSCILAEELGHYHTSTGDILDQSSLSNRKQEKQARTWSYKRLVSLHQLISAYKAGVRNKFELAEYLNVTEDFLLEALNRYKEEYGLFTIINQYTIYFEPLAVMEIFED